MRRFVAWKRITIARSCPRCGMPWQVEVANALGKAVVKGKVPLSRALDIWDELLLLPIRQVAIGSIPQLLQLAVRQDL